MSRRTGSELAVTILATLTTISPLAAQRAPVLQQVKVRHPYYYRGYYRKEYAKYYVKSAN